MGKLVAKTAIITFLVIAMLIGAVIGMCIWLAPMMVAETCESMGLDAFSIKMYERAYKKDNSISNLHLLVSKSIVMSNDDILMKYYPQLEKHESYNEFISALDSANYDPKADVIVNVKLSNEDNRLKTRYVTALAKEDFDGAFDYAVADLYNTDVNSNAINFCVAGLAKYIDNAKAEYFVDLDKTDYAMTVSQKIEQLYNDLKLRYSESAGSDYDKAILSGKLVDMLQFMLLIEGKTQDSGLIKETLTNDLAVYFAEYKQYID